MLAQVARLEFADAGVGVSLVYPSVTATEFHERLWAGSFVGGAHHIPVDPPELAAQAIVFAITSGDAHVLVGAPPRAITPGAADAWGALLARQALRPSGGSRRGGHVIVVAAARPAGVKHVVHFSVTHPQLEPLLTHQANFAVERAVLLARMPFTILQPMHSMQNIDVARVIATGIVAQPYDTATRLAHVDHEDVAKVAARVVTDPADHDATDELCGDDFRDARGLARIISTVSSTAVTGRQMPVAAAFTVAGGGAADDYRADAMVRLFDHYGRYGITGNSNVLGWLLGRPPTRFDAYVRRYLPA